MFSAHLHFFLPPSAGTATAMMWTLRAEGRLFHSGLPHKGINSLEMAMEAVNYVQTQFYKDFPAVSLTVSPVQWRGFNPFEKSNVDLFTLPKL